MKTWPANLAVEQSVLASIISDSNLLNASLNRGLGRDCFTGDHVTIFDAVMKMRERGIPVDVLAVAEFMGNPLNVVPVLTDATFGAVIEFSHTMHHVGILQKKARLRELARLGNRLTQESLDPLADPDEICRHALQTLSASEVSHV